MENERKVFSSNIIRSNKTSKNNLYDILHTVPVEPLPKNVTIVNKNASHNCDFTPKCDKFYIPKKKTHRKVKTVRDIRKAFEKDVYCDLPIELEKQRNLLLRKIRFGSSRDDKTKEIANNMLKSDNPMSKSTWQMLMNINPEGHKFSSQYIFWMGKCIQVNGSKGGQNKFICKYDTENVKKSCYQQSIAQSKILTRKKRLLHHSLNIKFKPGPLTKKKDLDTSYQKYQFGEIELVNLPQPGLEIQTSYGKPLAPVIDTFLHKSFFHDNNDSISSKWAKFAVSVLGINKNGIINQISEDSCVTFDLNYKCFQHRLLMRHETDKVNQVNLNEITKTNATQDEESIKSDVRNIMDKVINTVEISLKQNEIYSGEDEPREIIVDNPSNSHSSNKTKRKFGELDRLDVTVIRISDSVKPDTSPKCKNDYCSLGCICDSLKCSYNLKRHCGQIECMFKCKCDFSKYRYKHSFDNDNCSDLIPGLINLDKRLGQTLAKEEHKFHQTVIVTDEKRILLKSDKRNWKTSKKYADFYSKMHLKTDCIKTKSLSIVCANLNCKNIEPWCMVHNLYKCFCKGKFTETEHVSLDEIKAPENDKLILKSSSIIPDTLNMDEKSNELKHESTENMEINSTTASLRTRVRYNMRCNQYNKKDCVASDNSSYSFCARAQPYKGRKYYDGYYYDTNKKILEMEKNDITLHKKIMRLIHNDEDSDNNIEIQNTSATSLSSLRESPSALKELLSNVIEHNSESDAGERAKRLPNKTKLVAWLEKSYKQYKQRVDHGLAKISLDPPKSGRLCLYSWDFILSRYRERKNYFLISKHKPFRIFMAIDIKNSFFDDCTNISDINLSDINNYPITVKNLLTNARDLKENFCILCGLSLCWELIGSVTKINENSNALQDENEINKITMPEENSSPINPSDISYDSEDLTIDSCTDKIEKSFSNQVSQIASDGGYDIQNLPINNKESTENSKRDFCKEVACIQDHDNTLPKIPMSKWFVMKVENDFTEIQFYRKGFFVKYESVVKAINVARVSGKTVRLSSQKCTNDQNDPQFGIYAIPSTEEFCVFIGPYEKRENLGIEAIKKAHIINSHVFPQTRTRGVWILTNKVDNLKVIDNPLLFISSSCLQNDKMVTLESDSIGNYNNIPEIACNVQNSIDSQLNSIKQNYKQVKPIKIRKTNGFYHLTSSGILKPIESPEKDTLNKSVLLNTNVADFKRRLRTYTSPTASETIDSKRNYKNENNQIFKPISEIPPQINASKNYGSNIPKKQNRKIERSMFILKPEEINKRSFEKSLVCNQLSTKQETTECQNVICDANDEISMDVENFLATSVICTPPRDEVYVISDDENESNCTKLDTLGDICKNVWIVCKNVENLGWIAGKKNSKGYLSFEFPGFNSSIYYPVCEALKKISQIYARKVYVPRHIELEWQVIESEEEIKAMKKLDEKYLSADCILTKRGLRPKIEVVETIESLSNMEPPSSSKANVQNRNDQDEELIKEKYKIMSNLEETSKTLDDESLFLWNRTLSNQGEIMVSFSVASEELRKELTNQLNCIKSDSES